MRYPPAILDEIRARLPVSAVVGKRVRLKKAGREWKGLSPFNAEKSPSFFVNDPKGFYHCFSSGKHGDIFTFLMETEGLAFPEAVERLAAEAGVALPKASRDAEVQERKRRSLHDVVEMAAAFFEAELQGRRGAKARDYLVRRSLSPETQRRFRIGYAPAERFALRDHLAERGIPSEMMAEAGLLVAGEDVAVPYDRFRDRVMFPIADLRGRVVAFGGRALAADVPAKYLNSPDTPLFQKGHLLYNAHQARKPAHERGTVIAVEGYVDAIALSAHGFPHVVAPLGTALTPEQLALLWRMADEPVLCFDGDGAGRRAAYRALDLALPLLQAGKTLRFALLPEGQDPDDLVRAGGAGAMERVLAGAKPLSDMLWARESEAGPLDTPERLAALERRLRESVGAIKDDTLRRHYLDDVRNRLAAGRAQAGAEAFRSGRPRRGAARQPLGVLYRPVSVRPTLLASAILRPGAGDSPREAAIISCLIAHPEFLHTHAETLAELTFEGHDSQRLRSFLMDAAAHADVLDRDVLASQLSRAGLTDVVERLAGRVGQNRWALDPHADPMRLEDALRQAITLHQRSHALHSELRAAERALAEEETEANFAWLREVQTQLSSGEGVEADRDDGR